MYEIIDLFRLFNLYEILLAYIREEIFFTSLTWFYPAFSGIFVSVLLCDHFIGSSDSQTVFVFQSCCSKIPMLWVESTWSISYNVTTTISYSITFITFCTHILLYQRKRQLETNCCAKGPEQPEELELVWERDQLRHPWSL